MINTSPRWAILRTSGARTLPLVRSLNDDGIEAWSPRKTLERRRGHNRIPFKVEVPILPTFAFVPAGMCDDIRCILASPVNRHPGFRLFTYRDAIPLILDKELAELRLVEERESVAIRKKDRYNFSERARVRVEDIESAFLGMSGVVESCDGKRAWVNFGGSLRVQIGAWKLLTEQVQAA